jgi:hypothetical protein
MTRAILAAFLLVLGAVLFVNRSEAVMGADAGGYVGLARMLDRGETTRPLPIVCASCRPEWLAPIGYVPARDGRMASFYPIGLPLHILLAARLGGWTEAPFFVSPLAALVLVLLTYWLGRRLHSELAGLIAALLMGCCAVFVFQSLQPMSDVLAAMWCTAAVVAAVEGRQRPRWSLAAGLFFGIAVLVRPTSALMLIPLAIALGGVRPWLRFLAGGIPAALALGAYNVAAFGSVLATGYEAGGATREFALEYFPARAAHYLRWTAEQFGPSVVAAFFTSRSTRVLFTAWVVPFFVFYSFYSFYDEWWYTRFLLPAYPALAVAAGIAFDRVVAWRRMLGILVVIAAVAWEARQIARFSLFYTDEDQGTVRTTAEWVARTLPPKSVVLSMEFSSTLLHYSTLRPLRWDFTPAEEAMALRPPYALLMEHEEAPFFRKFGTRYRRARTLPAGTLFVRNP